MAGTGIWWRRSWIGVGMTRWRRICPVQTIRLACPSPAGYWSATGHAAEVRDDRMFPPRYLRRVARERLGITPDEIDGGHTPALSRPQELADRPEAYAAGHGLRAGAIP